jgi:hypothetical protein
MNLLPNSLPYTSAWLCSRSGERPREWPLLRDQNLVLGVRQFLSAVRNVALAVTRVHLQHSPSGPSVSFTLHSPQHQRAPAISLLCPQTLQTYIKGEGREPTGCDKVCSFYCLNMFRGTNVPIIRSTISEYIPLLGCHT